MRNSDDSFVFELLVYHCFDQGVCLLVHVGTGFVHHYYLLFLEHHPCQA